MSAGAVASPPAGTLHATTLARRVGGGWCGVLVRGASGAGKSDVALRALAQGWRLVADDRTVVWTSGGRLYARAPDRLAGLMEVRGVGVTPHAALSFSRLVLVVDAADAEVERMPTSDMIPLLGLDIPRLNLLLKEPSAPFKMAVAMAEVARVARAGRL